MANLIPITGDLFPPEVKPEAIYSDRLRIHMVDGDGMEPELRSRRDFVLVAPVSEYSGEGIYLIESLGVPVLYRAQGTVQGKVLFKLDNPAYRDSGHICTREEFAECVLGIVVADIKVRDHRFLRTASAV